MLVKVYNYYVLMILCIGVYVCVCVRVCVCASLQIFSVKCKIILTCGM